jgi:hypothetical protein
VPEQGKGFTAIRLRILPTNDKPALKRSAIIAQQSVISPREVCNRLGKPLHDVSTDSLEIDFATHRLRSPRPFDADILTQPRTTHQAQRLSQRYPTADIALIYLRNFLVERHLLFQIAGHLTLILL